MSSPARSTHSSDGVDAPQGTTSSLDPTNQELNQKLIDCAVMRYVLFNDSAGIYGGPPLYEEVTRLVGETEPSRDIHTKYPDLWALLEPDVRASLMEESPKTMQDTVVACWAVNMALPGARARVDEALTTARATQATATQASTESGQ